MNYKQSLDFIHSRMKFGSCPGMERIEALCNAFDNPQDKLKFVHVAGTNGKGSTCNMISSILVSAGYNVGLFTSPYIEDFRERIQFNSQMIAQSELAEIITDIQPVVENLSKKGIEPTEFEIITVAAFLYFLKRKCDIVVLEVGLGGKLDSTNIIKQSEVSVICSISMDHTDVLGDTLLKIAEQKCGIFKENGKVVSYPQPDFSVERFIKEKAKQMNCEYTPSELSKIKIIRDEIDGPTILYAGLTFKIPLTGKHQIYNFSTAIAAINVLKMNGWVITQKNMIDGIQSVHMPARVEIINKSPLTVIDGGHNVEGIDALCHCLKKYCSDKKIIAVFGMMKDKEYMEAIKKLMPLCSKVYATTSSNPRSIPAKELAKDIKPYNSKVKAIDEPAKAYEKALKKAGEKDMVLVCGSLYLASDVKKLQK
ncbi:MAG: bifunctional folylpolyglutamate synthase/dihydrofolate synthase [Ruminococcus sp.]|nr:bifunctional folylpolyglutamate synthase/dihydrofolate synthase [Candidatus Copronaster equi]